MFMILNYLLTLPVTSQPANLALRLGKNGRRCYLIIGSVYTGFYLLQFFFFFFLFVCFTRYLVFCIAVLPHRPGVVYYHLLLRRETRIPGVAPFSFRIGIWDLFVHKGQKSYTPTAFGKLWTTRGVRCMKHASS